MPGPGQVRHARLPALRRPRVGLRQRHERPRRHGLPHQLRLHLDRRRPGLASASTTRRAALTAIRTVDTGNDPRWLQVVEGGPALIGSRRADATAWTAAPVTDRDQTGEPRPFLIRRSGRRSWRSKPCRCLAYQAVLSSMRDRCEARCALLVLVQGPTERDAGVMFVADDLAAWLVGLFADAGRRRL